MKKKLAMLLALVMVTVTMFGCGSDGSPDEGEKGNDSAAGDDGNDNAEDKEAADYKICLMIPGNLGDKSFFDASFDSIEVLESELGVKVDYIEVGNDTTKYYPTFVDLCEDDYDLILTISSNCDDALLEAAEEYPDQKFINLDTEIEDLPDNLYVMGTRANEMSYLAGVTAALKAEELGEDTIGFVGGMDIPGINEFLVGYIDGAQYVNPDIKVNSSYVGSFTDSAKGKENGLLLYNSGISVVYAAAGQSGLGVIDAAKELDKLVIGVDSDQALALEESSPEMAEIIITSAMKMISNMAVDAVSRAMSGDVHYGVREVFGLADGAVGIAKNKYYEALLSDDQKDVIDEVEDKVASGEIEIIETKGMTTEEISEVRESVRP